MPSYGKNIPVFTNKFKKTEIRPLVRGTLVGQTRYSFKESQDLIDFCKDKEREGKKRREKLVWNLNQ